MNATLKKYGSRTMTVLSVVVLFAIAVAIAHTFNTQCPYIKAWFFVEPITAMTRYELLLWFLMGYCICKGK